MFLEKQWSMVPGFLFHTVDPDSTLGSWLQQFDHLSSDLFNERISHCLPLPVVKDAPLNVHVDMYHIVTFWLTDRACEDSSDHLVTL